MTLTEREKWLFVLTVMKTSKRASSLPMKLKQEICEFIRKRIAPNISYDEWLKMEYDLRDEKADVMTLLMQGMSVAMGEGDKLPPEARDMFDQSEFAKLDNAAREMNLADEADGLLKELDKMSENSKMETIKQKILEYLREKDENKS